MTDFACDPPALSIRYLYIDNEYMHRVRAGKSLGMEWLAPIRGIIVANLLYRPGAKAVDDDDLTSPP